MAKQSYYPPQVDRKYERHPRKHNTDLQLELAVLIENNWTADTRFKELTEQYGDPSKSESLRKVFYQYFGPTDDERTFNEIIRDVRNQLGDELADTDALEEYWKHTGVLGGQSRLSDEDENEDNEGLSEAERNDIWEAGFSKGYSKGREDGAQAGFEKGRQSVLEDLPDDVVLEHFGEDAVQHAQAGN